jgi:hypothetical protein
LTYSLGCFTVSAGRTELCSQRETKFFQEVSMKHVATLALAGLAVSSSAFAQSTIVWDTARAISGGSKQVGATSQQVCIKDVNTFFVDAGNTLSVLLTDLGVALPSGDQSLTGRANCRIVVPVQVARGLYLADLTQTITFGVVKGSGATARVSANSSFFGYSLPLLSRGYNWGPIVNRPLEQISRTDTFRVNTPSASSWFRTWCFGRQPKGIYNSNLAVGIEKNNIFDEAQLAIDGLDVKFEVRPGALAFCPAT